MTEIIRGTNFRGEARTWHVDFGVGRTEDHRYFQIRTGHHDNQPIVQKIRLDDSEETRALLAHEISIGIRLRHRLPGGATYPRELTKLLGFDRDDEDATFLLMTASGTRLDRVGRIPDWSKFAASLFRGLRWLEAAGVVHRDLTPQNVFWDDDSQTVHIIDFGLAKVAGLRRDPGGVGRSPWSSPAQRRGIGEVCVDDDIYSAGLLIYQMATGVREELLPPTREALEAADPQLREVLAGIFDGPPPDAATPNPRPPGTRAILVERLDSEDIRPPSRSPDRFEEGRTQFDRLVERKRAERTVSYDPPAGHSPQKFPAQVPRRRERAAHLVVGVFVVFVLALVIIIATLAEKPP